MAVSLRALRPRPEWLPRASIGLGVAATVAMNVAAGSRGGPGGALTGTLTPAGFVVSLETLIFLLRKLARLPWGWAWCLGAGLPLAGLAAITGVISYLHALTVAAWTGNPAEAGLALTEHLLPLVADLMIATGSVALVALAVAAKPPARLAGAGRAEDRPSREGPAPRRPAGSARQRRGRAPKPLPGGIPAAELAALAAELSKRELAAELSRRAGEPVTVWAAEQIKKKQASGELVLNGSAAGAGRQGQEG